MKLARALALALAAAAVAVWAWMVVHRLAYPYDLEWMEGGELCHALRVLSHEPLYGPPSVDFIPYLYTPGYPVLLAALSKIVGLGYGMARAVSLVAFLGATVLGYVFARREGGDRATAAVAIAIPIAAYVPTGQWYELARPDSLYLALVTTAVLLAWWKRESHAGIAVVAALLVAAFFVKQTASPFMIAVGVALLFTNWRVVPTYAGTLAALGLPILWWANRTSGGWFWTYVFRLHQSHAFYRVRAFAGTPGWLIALVGPGLLVLPWALARRRSPGLLWACFFAAVGALVACIGFGTQWAHVNAFIPGVFFPAIAIGTAAGRLVSTKPEAPPRLRPTVVWALLALAIVVAPGGVVPAASKVTPREWNLQLHTQTGYDPRPYLPTAEDRALGDAVIARLRAAPGDVLIPFHPFYGYLAGKRTFLHRMGVMDIYNARLGPPRGLVEAIRDHRFSLAIFDDKIEGTWYFWPNILEQYRIDEQIRGPRCVAGAQTSPRYVLVPATAPAVLDREP